MFTSRTFAQRRPVSRWAATTMLLCLVAASVSCDLLSGGGGCHAPSEGAKDRRECRLKADANLCGGVKFISDGAGSSFGTCEFSRCPCAVTPTGTGGPD
jgi:hypothetical protein